MFTSRCRNVALLSCLAFLCVLAGCSAPAPAGPTVVVVVVESLRHDYVERAPTLARLAAEGGAADALVPVFPTNSAPSKAAVATGRLPGESGFVNNRFIDRRLNFEFEGRRDEYKVVMLVESLWITAARQNVPSGVINWRGSEVPFGGVSVTRRSSLEKGAGDAERVAELIDWIEESGPDAPRLMLVYLDELDDVSHKHGPEADQTMRALDYLDAYVAQIQGALEATRGKDGATLLVLGDHGMTSVSTCIYLKAFLAERGFKGRPFASGATAHVYLEPRSDAERARAALADQEEMYRVYLPDELPEHYGAVHPDRAGDIILVGQPGTYFRDLGNEDNPVAPAPLAATHGFPPEHPDMKAALVAWGRGVPANTRWSAPSILDVYPTVCHLLGIDPADGIDGNVLPGIHVEPQASEAAP